MEESKGARRLPQNAYKPLGPGESYVPYVPAANAVAEITPRSIVTGAFMAALSRPRRPTSASRSGRSSEAAIPIAILAVGMRGRLFGRRNTILENVIIQSIGAASGRSWRG